jgi:hypothetical protein
MKVKFNNIFYYAIRYTFQDGFVGIDTFDTVYAAMRQSNLTIFDEARNRLLYNLS